MRSKIIKFTYNAVAIGEDNIAEARDSMAIGENITNSTTNSVAIGYSSTATTTPAMMIKDSSTSTKVGVATSDPQSVLHVKGSFQLDNVSYAAPSSSTCSSNYLGRMQIVHNTYTYLYLCTSNGWKKARFE